MKRRMVGGGGRGQDVITYSALLLNDTCCLDLVSEGETVDSQDSW